MQGGWISKVLHGEKLQEVVKNVGNSGRNAKNEENCGYQSLLVYVNVNVNVHSFCHASQQVVLHSNNIPVKVLYALWPMVLLALMKGVVLN